MTGGTVEQGLIQANLIRALGNRLSGGPCRVLGSHVKIAVAGSIRYPDALVVCTPLPRGATVITDPVVVFEVLSPSTASVDRIVKNQEYRRYTLDPALCDVGAGSAGRDGLQPGWRRLGGPRAGREAVMLCRRSASSCRWPRSTRVWPSRRPRQKGELA